MWPARIRSAPAATSSRSTLVAMRDRPLARRPPRRAEHVMVEDDDAVRAVRRRTAAAPPRRAAGARGARRPGGGRGAPSSARRRASAPDECVGSVVFHCRSNSAHGRVKRAGNVYGRSWFPGTASTGGPSERRKPAARSCCVAAAPVGQVARRDDQFGLDPPRRARPAPARPPAPHVYPCGDRIHGGGMPPRPNEAIDS